MRNNSIPAQTLHSSYQDSAEIVIVGNGIAGLTAAVEARRLAPHKRILMITGQPHPTINTPALKQFTIGKLEREQLLAYPLGTERARGISVTQGWVDEISAQETYVRLAGGGKIGYGSLLIATGSVAAGLSPNLPGQDFDGVLTLHRLRDYLDLRRRLREVDEAVVIGAGVHAIETVTSLLHLGIQTSWLIRGKTCLSRVLDGRASELVVKHMQQLGAVVYSETEVVGIVGNVGAVAGVVTNQHKMLRCQLVLVCTGTSPEITLAERCSIPMMHERRRGILVNNALRTSVPAIYAAGDVAAINNPQTGVHETRAQWYSAVVQGCTAAAMMTGQPEAAIQSFGVPWHATRLGGLSMLTVGNPLGRTPGSITLADSNKGTYRRLSLLDDRLIGYISLGQCQADGLAVKRLIDEGLSIRSEQEALLKGTFDARKYFSQRRSQTVITLASGKVPVVTTAQTPLPPLAASLPETDPLHLPLIAAGAGEGGELDDNPYRQLLRPLSPVASLPVATPDAPRRLLSYEKKRGS